MYAQFKAPRTIFQPVRKGSKNRQHFGFEIFWAAQNPTEIMSGHIGWYVSMMVLDFREITKNELQEVDDFLNTSKRVASCFLAFPHPCGYQS